MTSGQVLLFTCGMVTAAPAIALAQRPAEPTARTVSGVPTELSQTFSAMKGVQSLPDGRVVVSDTRDRRVYLVDFGRNTAVSIGRLGAGPGEYQQPGNSYRARGGGVWVYDQQNSRYLTISRTGQLQEMVPLPIQRSSWHASEVQPDQFLIDTLGHVYSAVADMRAMLDGTDTVRAVTRYGKGGALDTLARLPESKMVSSKSQGNTSTRRYAVFSPQDTWGVAADGWVAIVRAAPYHVEWHAPDGRTINGPAIPYAPVAVTDDDRKAISQRMRGAAPRVSMNGQSSPVALPNSDDVLTTKEKPAFPANQPALFDPAGRLWVEPSAAATQRMYRYDVFDRQGRVVDRVQLPAGSRLIGIDATYLYAVRIDDDDLLHLQRMARPVP